MPALEAVMTIRPWTVLLPLLDGVEGDREAEALGLGWLM